MATTQEIPAGKTRCYTKSTIGRIWVDRATGEPTKLIFPIMVEVEGRTVEHGDFMSLDSNTTSKGTPFVKFTIDSLKMLGATRPEEDIANALDAGRLEVDFAWKDGPAEWVECEVIHNKGYINIRYGAGATLDPAKARSAGAAFRRAVGGSAPAAPAANPFASPTRAPGVAVSPPPVTRAPVAPAPADTPPGNDSIPF